MSFGLYNNKAYPDAAGAPPGRILVRAFVQTRHCCSTFALHAPRSLRHIHRGDRKGANYAYVSLVHDGSCASAERATALHSPPPHRLNLTVIRHCLSQTVSYSRLDLPCRTRRRLQGHGRHRGLRATPRAWPMPLLGTMQKVGHLGSHTKPCARASATPCPPSMEGKPSQERLAWAEIATRRAVGLRGEA